MGFSFQAETRIAQRVVNGTRKLSILDIPGGIRIFYFFEDGRTDMVVHMIKIVS
jgi:hypothetical protein